MPEQKHKITLIPIAKLKPYEKNARTHSEAQIAQVAASIEEFGFTNPVLIDSNGMIIAGHARVLAAQSLGMEVVPTISLDHLTPEQVRAYIIADNQLAMNAGWDESILGSEIKALQALDFDVGLLGFEDEDISRLLAQLDATGADGGHTDPDDVPEPPENAVTQKGDLWILGRTCKCPKCGKVTNV
ncbi:MAG: ParB/Srx family N-terminal domain-containing protein [Lentisphaerota bacterium]